MIYKIKKQERFLEFLRISLKPKRTRKPLLPNLPLSLSLSIKSDDNPNVSFSMV